MIARTIAWCARNPFLVITAAILLAVAGIWCMSHVPLDALPDISDVQVIIHTQWAGEPPSVIEDQVTYPIVTALLSAPRVRNVRAQTMFGDSYVFVVFQDGTDLYWARSRVTEYLQQIAGKLPADAIRPSVPMQREPAGYMNTRSSIAPTPAALQTCVPCRIGIFAISFRPFRAWQK